MKIVVWTLGCKVNQYESDALIYGLKNLGHEVYTKLTYADIYILNTCAVTNEAERKSRQTISKFFKLIFHFVFAGQHFLPSSFRG